jgi:hypothetical protein
MATLPASGACAKNRGRHHQSTPYGARTTLNCRAPNWIGNLAPVALYCVGFGNQYTILLTENLSVAASRFAVHLNDRNVILNLPTPNSATDQLPTLGLVAP